MVSLHVIIRMDLKKSAIIGGVRVKNLFPEVDKEEWVSGIIQFKYKKQIVQSQSGIVPPSVAGKSWHHVVTRTSNHLSPFSMHKDIGAIEYMRVLKVNTFHTNYFDTEGRTVQYDQIKPFMKKQTGNFRIYALDSLVDVKIDGRIYTLRQTK